MEGVSRKAQFFLWGLLVGVIVLIAVLFIREQTSRAELPVYGQVQPFVLTNQLGSAVTLSELAGKVWVADIIFTRCAGPCPKMTEEMGKLQEAFAPDQPLRLVTLTTDPEFDTPSVMKRYAERFDADAARWFFLTGTKSQIKDLAVGGLKLAAVEKEPELQQSEVDLFIHSTTFVVVDKQGRLRGVYESLEPGFQEKIQADIRALLKEVR